MNYVCSALAVGIMAISISVSDADGLPPFDDMDRKTAKIVEYDSSYRDFVINIAYEVEELDSKWSMGDIKSYGDFYRWERGFEALKMEFKRRFPEPANRRSRHTMERLFSATESFGWSLISLERSRRCYAEALSDDDAFLINWHRELLEQYAYIADRDIERAIRFCDEAKKQALTPYRDSVFNIVYKVRNLKFKWDVGDIKDYNDFYAWYMEFKPLRDNFETNFPQPSKRPSREAMANIFSAIESFERSLIALGESHASYGEAFTGGDTFLIERHKDFLEQSEYRADEDIERAIKFCNRATKQVLAEDR